MQDNPTIYLVTAYRHNHLERNMPVDPRFMDSKRNFVFYVVDKEGVPPQLTRPAVSEYAINPRIHEAGKKHFAEWSFLLTEYERPFASYPLYMLSTRFYEKNARLPLSLDDLWDRIFAHLRQYGWGYLPSYNRDFGFEDYAEYYRTSLIGTTLEGMEVIDRLYDVDFWNDCRYFSDFFCNYIGFASRKHLEQYVEFYLPLYRHFFDEDFREIRPVRAYVQKLNDVQRAGFRAEKPFTLLNELASHLFFHKNDIPFVGLSYDGFYEVHERHATGRLIDPIRRSDFRTHSSDSGLAMALAY